MTKHQRQQMAEALQKAIAPIEEEVDGFWSKWGKFGAKVAASKWTAFITLGFLAFAWYLVF